MTGPPAVAEAIPRTVRPPIDLFPAVVNVEGTLRFREVRLRVDRDRRLVSAWQWDRTTETVVPVFTDLPLVATKAGGRYLLTLDGVTATAYRAGGCGCGHPLKRWAPP